MTDKILDDYKDMYIKLAPEDKDLTILKTCYTKQLSLTPPLIYQTSDIPDKLPNDIIDLCARRAVYEACTIISKVPGDFEDNHYIASFSDGQVSQSWEKLMSPDLIDEKIGFRQMFWEIPQYIIKKYRRMRRI